MPGGSQDPGESLRRTAEREANEELGIDPTQLEILGTLNTIYIPPSDFTVFPYVGWLDRRPQFRPADSEVAEVIEVPLGRLLDPETRVTGKIQVASGDHLDLPYYAIDHHQVWGATALILSEFIERLRRVI